MARYFLIGISLLLAVAKFFDPELQSTATTVTGQIIYCLSYAFTPALGALLLASAKWGILKMARKPVNFVKDWHWIWGCLLAVVVLATFVPLVSR